MRVGSEGSINAQLAIVAEKPGQVECQKGRPLVGPTGKQVDGLLQSIGIPREAVYLTNSVKEVHNFDNPTRADIINGQVELYKELARMPRLNCIIALGQAALDSLSNFHISPIGKWRGSILESHLGIKMVPTYHPSFYMRGQWKLKPIVQFDMHRALEESYSRELQLPERKYNIIETPQDLRDLDDIMSGASHIAFDIETMRGRFIQCISFARDPKEGFCIPIAYGNRSSYWSIEEEVLAWTTIQNILNQKGTCYITQNGPFDCWHLWRHGVITPYMDHGMDTMHMHAVRAPDLPHDLGFLVSLYTREPFFKDESGDWKSQVRVPDDQFWKYNIKDSCTTLEISLELEQDLRSYDMWDYYCKEVRSLWPLVMDMRQRGMKISINALMETRGRLQEEIEAKGKQLESIVGWAPNTRSPTDMERLLHELGISPDRTATNRVKIDIDHFYLYANRYPQARSTMELIIQISKLRTLESGFTQMKLTEGQRYHPYLQIHGTKTGRFAGKGADEGGPQPQNWPASMRHLCIADDDECELTNVDLSQAEARLQAWFARDPLLIAAFKNNKDVHRVRACLVFKNWRSIDLPPDNMLASITTVCNDCSKLGVKKCNHSERYVGKESGHAFAYMMGPRRFCTEQREKGLYFAESRAKEIRDLVVSSYLTTWHREVYLSLKRSPWLINPLGKKREFYGLLDDEMLRQALAWLCSSPVTQVVNRAALRLQRQWNLTGNPYPRFITQTHDSLTICNLKTQRDQLVEALHNTFQQEITIKGDSFIIPIDISHGESWGDLA